MNDDELAARYDEAVAYTLLQRSISITALQKGLRMSYPVAALCIEMMEREKIITAPLATGKRNVNRKPKYTPEQLLASG